MMQTMGTQNMNELSEETKKRSDLVTTNLSQSDSKLGQSVQSFVFEE
jgi:hypothetical protein